jgi:hypothetical protein
VAELQLEQARGLRTGGPEVGIPEAVGHVVVDQSRRLHYRINDGGPDKTKAASLEVGTQQSGSGVSAGICTTH